MHHTDWMPQFAKWESGEIAVKWAYSNEKNFTFAYVYYHKVLKSSQLKQEWIPKYIQMFGQILQVVGQA